MPITKRNYQPGVYEAITDEPLDDVAPVLNTWYYFKVDGWSHVLSDVVLKQSGTPIPGTAYELTEDEKYTDREAGESGKTLYGKWRIVDVAYDLIATTISANNFGSYVDNEAIKKKFDDLSADQVSYDNSVSGLTADDVQEAIDEIVAGSVYVPPSFGSEVTILSTSVSAARTDTVKIENANPQTKLQYGALKISIETTTTYIISVYIIPSTTGAEAGATSWAKVLDIASGASPSSTIVQLPMGMYRVYVYLSGGGSAFTYSLKYRVVDSNVTYP